MRTYPTQFINQYASGMNRSIALPDPNGSYGGTTMFVDDSET